MVVNKTRVNASKLMYAFKQIRCVVGRFKNGLWKLRTIRLRIWEGFS